MPSAQCGPHPSPRKRKTRAATIAVQDKWLILYSPVVLRCAAFNNFPRTHLVSLWGQFLVKDWLHTFPTSPFSHGLESPFFWEFPRNMQQQETVFIRKGYSWRWYTLSSWPPLKFFIWNTSSPSPSPDSSIQLFHGFYRTRGHSKWWLSFPHWSTHEIKFLGLFLQ